MNAQNYLSNLQRKLSEGQFAVTCEIGPPKGADKEEIKEADAYQRTKVSEREGAPSVKSSPTLKPGEVGFAVSSYNVVPISIKVDSFKAQIPD